MSTVFPTFTPTVTATVMSTIIARFDILSLWENSEEGIFNDITTWPTSYFEDTAGTDAAELEDTVALILDQSQGLELGSELVTNGTFDSDTDWVDSDTGTGTSVISGGVLTLTFNTSANLAARDQSFSTVAGKTYKITCVLGGEPTLARIDIGTTQGANNIKMLLGAAASNNSFVATSATTWIRLSHQNSVGSLTYDNISVKELKGNHLIQATAGARGKVSARYNLLERTEEFDNDTYWTKLNTTISDNAANAPTGSLTADKLVETATSGAHSVSQTKTIAAGKKVKLAVYVKAEERQHIRLQITNTGGTTGVVCAFNVATGTSDSGDPARAFGTGSEAVASIQDVGSGWYQCSLSGIIDASSTSALCTFRLKGDGTQFTYAGDITKGLYIWGADFRPVSDTDQPAYQRVTTATDYDSEGFDPYLLMNRVDDNYTVTLAAGTYTVAIGTRQGIWIDTVEHAGGTFTFGPTTYTGGPTGLFSIIGDKFISPPTLVDRVLTTSEKNALVQWYQARGAGALYDSSAISWDSATDTYGGIYA